MRRCPSARHNVLDVKLPARDAFPAQPGLASLPSTKVILNSLEDHSQPATSQAAISQQGLELLPDLVVVRPVATGACLSGKEGF